MLCAGSLVRSMNIGHFFHYIAVQTSFPCIMKFLLWRCSLRIKLSFIGIKLSFIKIKLSFLKMKA